MYYYDPFFMDNNIEDDEVFVNMSIFNKDLCNYFISNYGRVYSVISRRYLKPQENCHGYYYIALGANFREYIHRLVAMAFVPGRTDEKNCVNHKNGNKKNNYFKNLEWCSKAENNTHAYETHLNNCIGENCRSAKLTNEQVRYICQLLQDGYGIYDIMDTIGMERTQNNYEIIRSIRKGYAWKSISKDYNIEYTNHIHGSISKEDVIKVCECFEQGMSIKETYENVFGMPFISIKECDKYNTLRNIHSRRSYTDISSNYNF